MKIAWIVDGAYLMKASPGKIDFLKLRKVLETTSWGDSISESYYLNSTPNPPSDAQDAFHTKLKLSLPDGPNMRVMLYKLKEMRCKCPKCNTEFDRTVQKGVDVGIATLLIRLAHQDIYDRVILSAGDGDFEDAVRYIIDTLKKEFWIAGFRGSISPDLQSYSKNTIYIDDLWTSVQLLA